MESFLLQATIYLLAATIAVPLSARFGLGSVLGYLAAGIVIGPVLGLVGSGAEMQDLQHFAEFGVVMMLFLIGLDLDPRDLWRMRHRLLGLGGLQVAATLAAVMAGAMAFGLDWRPALAVGMILALSSTAIVMQTLSEKGLTQTAGGRASFAVLLMQDLAVIPMLAAIPLLAASGAPAPDGPGAGGALSFIQELPGWAATLVTLAAVGAVVFGGHYLTRPIFRFVHLARLREMFTVVALLIVVGTAVVMNVVGLSPALGTFLAGVVLANSEFRHELRADIEPFKGLLLGLFFITVGAGFDFGVFLAAPVAVLGLTFAVMALKGAILFALGRLFRLRGRDHWLFTLGLAQAGEFGFVLISFSDQQDVLPPGLGQTLLLAIALSMLATPLFFLAQDRLARRGGGDGGAGAPEPDAIDAQQPIIIAGVGRFGQVVNRMLQMSGVRATVLDHDLATIKLMRTFGFTGYFGDPTRPDLLHAAGLATARALVVALDDRDEATRLTAYARRARPDLFIVTRARDRVHVYELYRAGADKIVRELFDASLRAGRYVLENTGFSEAEAHDLEQAFYQIDRETVRELAGLWDPDIPIHQNPAYVARARALNKELETALATRFGNRAAETEKQRDAAQ